MPLPSQLVRTAMSFVTHGLRSGMSVDDAIRFARGRMVGVRGMRWDLVGRLANEAVNNARAANSASGRTEPLRNVLSGPAPADEVDVRVVFHNPNMPRGRQYASQIVRASWDETPEEIIRRAARALNGMGYGPESYPESSGEISGGLLLPPANPQA